MANFLDEHGLSVVWERIKELIDKKILKGLAGKLDKQDSKGTGYIAYNPSSSSVGNYASVFGYDCTATSTYAHSEGYVCTSSGQAAHAEGYYATANRTATHAEGYYTTASSNYQHVQGKYNVIDSSSTYADIVGWGTSATSSGRKNIEATTTTGDKRLKGDVYVGCNDDSSGGNKLIAENKLKDMFAVEYYESSSKSISAGSSGSITQGITKTGYYPLGVVGTYCSGTNVPIRGAYLTNVANGSATINYYLRNVSSSAQSVTVTTRVLWVKI